MTDMWNLESEDGSAESEDTSLLLKTNIKLKADDVFLE